MTDAFDAVELHVSDATLQKYLSSSRPIPTIPTDDGAYLQRLDPATRATLEDYAGFGDAPDDVELGPIPREIARSVTARAAIIGYRAARIALGTDDKDQTWSRDEHDADALLDEISSIDIGALPYPATWSSAIVDDVITEAGYDPETQPLASVASMAFDSGVMAALLEHDRM